MLRIQLIIKELLGYNADVICLQEVDNKVFDHHLQPLLKAEGLEGVFDRKGGVVSEGVACFWLKSKFELETTERLVIGEALEEKEYLKDFKNSLNGNESLKEMVIKRTTALQTVMLKDRNKSDRRILIGKTNLINCRLYFL